MAQQQMSVLFSCCFNSILAFPGSNMLQCNTGLPRDLWPPTSELSRFGATLHPAGVGLLFRSLTANAESEKMQVEEWVKNIQNLRQFEFRRSKK